MSNMRVAVDQIIDNCLCPSFVWTGHERLKFPLSALKLCAGLSLPLAEDLRLHFGRNVNDGGGRRSTFSVTKLGQSCFATERRYLYNIIIIKNNNNKKSYSSRDTADASDVVVNFDLHVSKGLRIIQFYVIYIIERV